MNYAFSNGRLHVNHTRYEACVYKVTNYSYLPESYPWTFSIFPSCTNVLFCRSFIFYSNFWIGISWSLCVLYLVAQSYGVQRLQLGRIQLKRNNSSNSEIYRNTCFFLDFVCVCQDIFLLPEESYLWSKNISYLILY